MLRERDAVELAQDIESEYGPDSARVRQLGNKEWVVDIMGYATRNKVRVCIYRCWSRQDWRTIPPVTKTAIRRGRKIKTWAENQVKVPNMIRG